MRETINIKTGKLTCNKDKIYHCKAKIKTNTGKVDDGNAFVVLTKAKFVFDQDPSRETHAAVQQEEVIHFGIQQLVERCVMDAPHLWWPSNSVTSASKTGWPGAGRTWICWRWMHGCASRSFEPLSARSLPHTASWIGRTSAMAGIGHVTGIGNNLGTRSRRAKAMPTRFSVPAANCLALPHRAQDVQKQRRQRPHFTITTER